jgi:lysozyme
MQLTQAIIDHFKAEEGYRTVSYLDTLGYWTIGIGHMLGKGAEFAHITWTDEEIIAQLQKDVDHAAAEAEKLYPRFDHFSEGLQIALLDMCFQLGEHLAGFHTMNAEVNAGHLAEAADDALQTLWARQTPHRARRDADLIRNGSINSAD